MSPSAIEIDGLRKSFGTELVLDGIDLRVATGSIFALLGPNGAGKTTLISILSTLLVPDAGTARIAGFDVVTEREQVTASISLTGQSVAVDDILTGTENLRMMARLSGYSASGSRARAGELIEAFDLNEAAGKRVKTYSGGMRRRLDLALSLVARPPVIFLDEPTTGLDTRSRLSLWMIIRELAGQGTTVFLTTQYLDEADQLAGRIAVIDSGRIVAEGTAPELKARIGGDVVELRDHADRVLREIATDGTLDGLRDAIDDLERSGATEGKVGIRRPSMDDVFLALTGGGARDFADSARSADFADSEMEASRS
jgi:ABC-2 type transport system ATP-binding protein